jgi:hypothetical protein
MGLQERSVKGSSNRLVLLQQSLAGNHEWGSSGRHNLLKSHLAMVRIQIRFARYELNHFYQRLMQCIRTVLKFADDIRLRPRSSQHGSYVIHSDVQRVKCANHHFLQGCNATAGTSRGQNRTGKNKVPRFCCRTSTCPGELANTLSRGRLKVWRAYVDLGGFMCSIRLQSRRLEISSLNAHSLPRKLITRCGGWCSKGKVEIKV